MSGNDRKYFEKRAEAEIAMAQKASQSEAVRAHYELACAYLDKIYPEQRGDAA